MHTVTFVSYYLFYMFLWRPLYIPPFKIHIESQLIRFLPVPTGRNSLDFSQKSLLVDACIPLEHFVEVLPG